MMSAAPIGVFDSGVGGLSILRALRAELPAEDFVYFADSAHAPYGERGDAYVEERSRAIARHLVDARGIKALVIACNTATAAAVHVVREAYPHLPIVGVEPALKPALALTSTGRIGVMATRGTLESRKFAALLRSLAGQAQFVLQPCDGLADAIESADEARTAALCELHVRALGPLGAGGIDTLVLGCTHYPFVRAQVQALAGGGVRLVDTGEPVARQARRLLAAAGALAERGSGSLLLEGTGDAGALRAAAARWLDAQAA